MASTNPAAAMTQRIASMQDFALYRELSGRGRSRTTSQVVRRRPQVTRNAYQRVVRHDHQLRDRGVHRQQEEAHPLQLLQGRAQRRRRTPSTASTSRSCGWCTCSRPRPRATAPRSASSCCTARSDPPSPRSRACSRRASSSYSRTPDGALYTFSWVNLGGVGIAGAENDALPQPHARGAAAPHPRRSGAPQAIEELGLSNEQFKVRVDGDLDPACRFIFNGADGPSTTATGPRSMQHVRVQRLVLSEKDRVGIGTFQPKDEKNQDSTELTGDINYRKIAEYGSDSDPRAFNFDGEFNIANRGHRRVHRGAQARRRVPLRSARRVAGAQDQAEEVRPDRHRRGHHRPHQRGRVQEAPEQRVHGGPARPHHQDRHPLHHAAVRGGPHLREGLQLRQDRGQAHRAAHARGRRDVGGA